MSTATAELKTQAQPANTYKPKGMLIGGKWVESASGARLWEVIAGAAKPGDEPSGMMSRASDARFATQRGVQAAHQRRAAATWAAA